MKNNKKSFGDLVEMNKNQEYPRMAKPEDFGPTPPAPTDNGDSKLEPLKPQQEMTRHVQDGGPGKSGAGTPSVWGKADGMTSSQNHSEEGTKVAGDNWVDFKDGQHSCSFGMKK